MSCGSPIFKRDVGVVLEELENEGVFCERDNDIAMMM